MVRLRSPPAVSPPTHELSGLGTHRRWLVDESQRSLVSLASTAPLHKDVRALTEHAASLRVIEVEQQAGEILFVPSGWYHQVENVTDTISINHNVSATHSPPTPADELAGIAHHPVQRFQRGVLETLPPVRPYLTLMLIPPCRLRLVLSG